MGSIEMEAEKTARGVFYVIYLDGEMVSYMNAETARTFADFVRASEVAEPNG
jgi:hypothetical protein